MELLKIKCPECKSYKIQSHSTYQTKNHGNRTIFKCQACSDYFSETKNTFMEGLRKPISLVWRVLNNRTEGQGLNANARVFGIAKNTILDWERKFSRIQEVLLVYSLAHKFLQLVIEGDELYTKVGKNISADESLGWTIVLMDRASRFIWELSCGKKQRKLFKNAIRTLAKIIKNTDDISIFTDGERRYGNILFEICYTIVKDGSLGRPKKLLKKGLGFELKTKVLNVIKRGVSALNIKILGQNIQKQNNKLKIKIFMQTIWKPLTVRCGENALLLEEEQIHMLKATVVCKEF